MTTNINTLSGLFIDQHWLRTMLSLSCYLKMYMNTQCLVGFDLWTTYMYIQGSAEYYGCATPYLTQFFTKQWSVYYVIDIEL